MSKQIPLLVVSDAVSASTGLARIARDLTVRIHTNISDLYRVASAGYGGPTSRHFGFHQYALEGVKADWVLPTLPEIWNDHAGDERGAILFIWDSSRLSWFSQPELFEELLEGYPGLKAWLLKPNFEKWLYCPIDAEGPRGRLTFPVMKTLLGFDRIIAYTGWGADVIGRTIGDAEAEKRRLTALPHGVDEELFYELPRQACRKAFFTRTGAQSVTNRKPEPLSDDEYLVSILATNQARKDWALAIETAAIIAHDQKVRLWAHTDILERAWSIPALLVDHGMVERTVISTGNISDENMAVGYSASDLVIGNAPEGFGYVEAEAQFCGTPVITGSYAGAAEIVPPERQIAPVAFRYDGVFSSKRPVYDATDWARKASEWLGERVSPDAKFGWERLWPRWEAMLRSASEI